MKELYVLITEKYKAYKIWGDEEIEIIDKEKLISRIEYEYDEYEGKTIEDGRYEYEENFDAEHDEAEQVIMTWFKLEEYKKQKIKELKEKIKEVEKMGGK